MKNTMFKAIAALGCAVILAACGGGSSNQDATTPPPPQPAYGVVPGEQPGTGTISVANGDLVTFYATGYLYDEASPNKKGENFQPVTSVPRVITVGVGSVIAGIDQGLVGMKVGGKRTVLIPASMAFGPTGYTDADGKVKVPPNTAVVFDLEVVTFTTLSVIPKTDTVVGTGAVAASKNLVTIKYAGYLRDETKADKKGTKFDESTAPFAFLLDVNSRIQGWDLGILGMKVGGQRTLFIPSSFAWGKDGRKNSDGSYLVPPNTDVVYDIELTAVNASPPASTVQPAFANPDDLIGTGDLTAANGDKLTVHYSGYLYNDAVTDKKGVRFDTSRVTGVPYSLTLGAGNVIAGWDKGIVGMKVGGKRTLIIPASLAYGSEAKTGIPANSALIFEVELVTLTR